MLQTALQERLQFEGMRAPEDFRTLIAGQRMQNSILNLPQLDALTGIDSEGNLVNFSRSWPIPAVNVADRDYFKVLKTDPNRTSPDYSHGWRTWRKPLIDHRIWLRDLNPIDFGPHARQG